MEWDAPGTFGIIGRAGCAHAPSLLPPLPFVNGAAFGNASGPKKSLSLSPPPSPPHSSLPLSPPPSPFSPLPLPSSFSSPLLSSLPLPFPLLFLSPLSLPYPLPHPSPSPSPSLPRLIPHLLYLCRGTQNRWIHGPYELDRCRILLTAVYEGARRERSDEGATMRRPRYGLSFTSPLARSRACSRSSTSR